jgi:hypothetical protein
MRRIVALVLGALGAFLIVLAVITRFVVVPEAVKFPLNENSISTLIASNASYFSPSKLTELTGAQLQDTVTVQGDNAAGDTTRAVWNNFSYVYDTTNKLTYSYTYERLAFDRRSAELINCCGTAVGTTSYLHPSGLGFVWPIGAQKKTYQYFDTTLLKPEPMVYSGTAVVNGLTTYKYVETLTAVPVGSQTLPGSLVGQPAAPVVTLKQYNSSTTTEFVDPATGAPVKAISIQHMYLGDSSGGQALNLLNATFTTSPSSVASNVQSAKHRDAEIKLLSVILPVIFGLAGIILLIMGVILAATVRRFDEYDDGYSDEYDETGQVTA